MSHSESYSAKLVVVCGTGTEVGKTHVSCAVLTALRVRGDRAVGIKPIESGLTAGVPSDAQRLAQAAGHRFFPPRYGFAAAISPHLAARRAGQEIDVAEAVSWVHEQVARETATMALVETAGGLLTPLSGSATNLELALALVPNVVVVVATDRLGALHDVSAVTRILETSSLRRSTPVVVVLAEVVQGGAHDLDNGGELRRLGIAKHVVQMPHGHLEEGGTRRAAETILDACGIGPKWVSA